MISSLIYHLVSMIIAQFSEYNANAYQELYDWNGIFGHFLKFYLLFEMQRHRERIIYLLVPRELQRQGLVQAKPMNSNWVSHMDDLTHLEITSPKWMDVGCLHSRRQHSSLYCKPALLAPFSDLGRLQKWYSISLGLCWMWKFISALHWDEVWYP